LYVALTLLNQNIDSLQDKEEETDEAFLLDDYDSDTNTDKNKSVSYEDDDDDDEDLQDEDLNVRKVHHIPIHSFCPTNTYKDLLLQ
jgi:hypothetical protein